MQTEICSSSHKDFRTFSCFSDVQKACSLVGVLLFMVTMPPANAEAPATDKFMIALGGYSVFRYDSIMSLTEPNLGAGISISPEDTLGLNTEQSVVRLDGYYRFTDAHALTYSWYSIASHGNKTIEEQFDWIDKNGDPVTIPVGAKVNTIFDYDIYKLGYLWSFYHTDKVEMGVGAGLHVTRIGIGLHADTTSSGVDTRNVDTTLPLPVLSLSLRYRVTPRFHWYFKSEFFALQFDQWDGTYTDSTLGMEYRIFDNIGLGAAFAGNALKLTEDTTDYKFRYDNRITGILVNIAAYF